MQVMTLHNFYDTGVEKVIMDGICDNREIVLKDDNDGSLLINKNDVIALAKEFGLIVYEKNSNL